MGFGIAATVNVRPKSDLTLNSPSGVYVSADGSLAFKGDSDGKKNKRGPKVPATKVFVTSGVSGRSFVKDIDKLTDEYKYVGPLTAFNVVRKDGVRPTVQF